MDRLFILLYFLFFFASLGKPKSNENSIPIKVKPKGLNRPLNKQFNTIKWWWLKHDIQCYLLFYVYQRFYTVYVGGHCYEDICVFSMFILCIQHVIWGYICGPTVKSTFHVCQFWIQILGQYKYTTCWKSNSTSHNTHLPHVYYSYIRHKLLWYICVK